MTLRPKAAVTTDREWGGPPASHVHAPAKRDKEYTQTEPAYIRARETPAATERCPLPLPSPGCPQGHAGVSHSTLPTQRVLQQKNVQREAESRVDAHHAHAAGAPHLAWTNWSS